MKNIKISLLAILAIGLFGCENDTLDDLRNRVNNSSDPLPELTAGEADFSTYVALGASFTAGYTDNGLFSAAQENSFPNIIAGKFAMAGGGTFNQPLTNDNFGGLALNGSRIVDPRLVFGGAGPVPLESVIGPVTVSTDILLNNPTGPFHNLGVPGAKSFHLLAPGYGNIANFPTAANPYFIRMTGSDPNATVLELAVDQTPTFFTISEIGGNDVLGFATSGGTGLDQTGNIDPSTYGGNDITDPSVFAEKLTAVVQTLTANGAKGAIGNIPDITSLSYFTTVPHNPIPLDEPTAAFLNSASAYGAYNDGIALAFAFLVANTPMTQEMADAEIAKRTINFNPGEGNAVVIMDETLTDLTAINPALISMRQATQDDLIVLPAASFIGTEAVSGNPQTVNGVAIPLGDEWVLLPSEQEAVANATASYNATISDLAQSYGLALVDLNSILEQAAATGILYDNYLMNTDLVFGGLVSLDGIHLTARGYSLMANAFLEAIDNTYGSNFVASGNVAHAGDYPTNYNPQL